MHASRTVKSLGYMVLAVAAATLARWALNPLVQERILFTTYFAAIAFAAWHGGIRMGILAAVLSYVAADYFFIEPRYSVKLFYWDTQALSTLLAYSIVTATILILTEVLTRANRRSQQLANNSDEQHRLLDVTLRSIGDAVIAVDSQTKITFMNGVAERLTGWDNASAIGQPLEKVFNIVNEQTRKPVENPCERVLRTGATVGLANHTVLISKSGVEIPVDDSAAPILSDEGRLFGVVLVFRDVTLRRRAEQTDQRLAAIVEHLDDAVISKNMEGVITSWNAAAERLYGFTPAEAIGQHISIIVPQDHRDELVDIMRRLRAGERIDHWDTVRAHKDGALVDVSLRISPIKDSAGVVIGASKVARDITQRRRTEETLALLASASNALASLIDREGALEQVARLATPRFADWCVIFCANAAGTIEPIACAHGELEKERRLRDLVGRKATEGNHAAIAAPTLRQGESRWIQEVAEEHLAELARDDEARAVVRDLNPRSLISVPLRIRGTLIGAMLFVMADSQRRFTASDLQFAEDLAARMSTGIDNARLFQSVQESVRQKDEFMAMLAHELRNPLAAIRYATTLAQLPSAEPPKELFEVIDRQVINFTRLIDDLLDVARIGRDKLKLKLQQIDASVIASHSVAAARPLMEQKRHQLTVDIAAEPMPLLADATRAEQIIANLLTNAAKYTPEGGRIALSVHPSGDGMIVITVEDTGIGLPPEMLARVFEPFTQADRTLDRSDGGLGVGLTIVKGLAELHGGSVSVSSAGLGRGSQFTVRLPRGVASAPLATSGLSPREANGAKLRILVVDDNQDTASLSARWLKSQGHDVQVAFDGPTGLDIARTTRPDVMLLDIGLPQLNGYEMSQILRREGVTAMLIAVTGYGQSEDQRRSSEAGFNHHLVKPVDHDQLHAILSRIVPAPARAP